MPSEETLSVISQLGIAYAAFVAIFFAFSRGLGEFSTAQKLRIRTILSTCFWVMFVVVVVAGVFPITGRALYLIAALGGLALCTTNFLTLAFEKLFKGESN
ncbi:MAG: hypothetical protein ACI9ON_001977 [Limisphaerales bacterium]|jgi:hypothetical protein